MDGKSLDIKQEKISQLKDVMPEIFTEDNKIDFDKLKLTLGEDINTDNERYVLNWAGKSEAFKVLQTPTTATLAPNKDESVNFDTTENIFIEGENLEVLKILQKSYYGKIKMIYIDPPYNTGNDSFIYPDKFSETKEEYLKRIGEKDEEGYLLKEGLFRKNSKENGQYHSNWLNMMYPRLFLAKNLLSDDGVIFVSIDDNEVHNLRLIMNEIFGEENFRNAIIRKRGAKSVQRQFDTVDKLGSGYETILFYTKKSDYRFKRVEIELDEPKGGSWNNHWRGTERPTMRYELFGIIPETGQWRWSEARSQFAIENYEQLVKDLQKDEMNITQEDIDKWWNKKLDEDEIEYDLLRKSSNGKPEHYITPSNTKLGNDNWMDIPPNGTSILKRLFGYKIFDNPKPLELGDRLIRYFTEDNDIILDFFAGSGTIGHNIYEINKELKTKRKFLLIQLPEKIEEKSQAYKHGFYTISKLCIDRLKKVIIRINNEKEKNKEISAYIDLGFKVFKIKYSNFKLWRGDVIENGDDLVKQIGIFENPVKEGTEEENILYELLLKSGYELTTRVVKKDNYYSITDGELIIALKEINDEIIKEIIKAKPIRCIMLDKLFNNNDQLKTNTVLQMRDAGVEFRTV
jgi:adenine-specific DNA-methyltransferase